MTDAKVPDGGIHRYCFPSLGEPCGNCHRCQPPKPDGGGLSEEESAWLAYRDEYQRQNPWCDPRRLGRQIRKREFVAGYRAARLASHAEEVRAARAEAWDEGFTRGFYDVLAGGDRDASESAAENPYQGGAR